MLNHKILGGASAMLGALAFFSANPVKADAASNVHISRLDEGFITNEVNQDHKQHVKQMQSAAPTSPKEQSLNSAQPVGKTKVDNYQTSSASQPTQEEQTATYQTPPASQPAQKEQTVSYQALPTGKQATLPTLATFPTSKSNTWSQSLADMPTNTHTVNQDPGETGEIINGRDLTLDLNSGTTQNDSNSDKKQEGIIQVKLIDDDSNGRVLDTETYTGNVGDKIGAPATKDVVYYMNRGYFLMDKNYGPDTKFSNMVQNFEAHFAHGHQFFSPDHPAIVGNDLNRQMDYPLVTEEMTDYERKVQTTVNYTGADNLTPKSQTLTADFTRYIEVDNVTGQIITKSDWETEDQTDYQVPQLSGYKASMDAIKLTPDSPNQITVNYTKVAPKATITLNFEQNGQKLQDAQTFNTLPIDLPSFDLKHIVGIRQGDTYVSDLKNLKPDQNGDIKATVEYTDDDLGQTESQTITAKSIVHFKDADGNTLQPDSVAQADFIKTPDTVDLDTNKTVKEGSWNHNSYKVTINVPVIQGYLTDSQNTTVTLTRDQPVIEQTIVYHKLGRVLLVDRHGRVLAVTTYPNNATNPGVANVLTLHDVKGYTPNVKYILPTNAFKDKKVLCEPINGIDAYTHITKLHY